MAAYVDSGSFIDSEDTGLLFITGHLRDALKSLDQLHRELFDEVIGKLKLPGVGSPPGAPPAG
jgi:hypothetical protein